jgi:hypothetical protein
MAGVNKIGKVQSPALPVAENQNPIRWLLG